MKTENELKLRKYINERFLKHNSIISIRDLVLFLQLSSHKEYVELATELDSIEHIPGLANISLSASELHKIFGRRNNFIHKLNIFSHIYHLLFTHNIQFNPDDINHRYFLQIEIERFVNDYVATYKDLLKLELVKNHINVLTKLLLKQSAFNKKSDLTEEEISKTIAKFNLDLELRERLKKEYLDNLEKIKFIFNDNLDEDETKLSKRYLTELTKINISSVTQTFTLSRYATEGIYFRISPEAKLAIESYIIGFILTNITLTLLLKYILPHILILDSTAITSLIFYGVTNLLPILIPILVNKYSHSHYQQAAKSRKIKLVNKLCKQACIFEYRSRLVKSGFNIRDEEYTPDPKTKRPSISTILFAEKPSRNSSLSDQSTDPTNHQPAGKLGFTAL